MMRIFAQFKLGDQSIFDKLQNYLIKRKYEIDLHSIADVIFAYSYANINDNKVLNEMQHIVEGCLVQLANNSRYDLIIDILLSYLLAEKGDLEFIERLKNSVLNTYIAIKPQQIDSSSILKLYTIFKMLNNLPDDTVVLFDTFLRNKLKYYNSEDYKTLIKTLLEIKYKNVETLNIIMELDRTNDEPSDKYKVLLNYKLIS